MRFTAVLLVVLCASPSVASARSTQDHRIFPRGKYLINGQQYVFGLDMKAVYRLDKRTGKRETIVRGRQIMNHFRVIDDNHVIFQWQNESALHLWQLKPLRKTRVPLPSSLPTTSWEIESAGQFARFDARQPDSGFRVVRVALKPPFQATTIFSSPWARTIFGAGNGNWLFYSTLWPAQQRGQDPRRRPYFKSVYALDARTGKRTEIFRFSRASHLHKVYAFSSRSYRYGGVYVQDAATQQRWIITHDFTSSQTFKAATTMQGWGHHQQAKCAFAPNGKLWVCAGKTASGAQILRFDPAGRQQVLATVGPAGKLHGIGMLSDNQTVWVHHHNRLHLISSGGRRSVDLRPFSRKGNPEFAGLTVFHPDYFYVGIERRAWRYFMRVKLSVVQKRVR